jgi:hypothetical protein
VVRFLFFPFCFIICIWNQSQIQTWFRYKYYL